jgi:NitT/TauT family transport system substrate-binding protein
MRGTVHGLGPAGRAGENKEGTTMTRSRPAGSHSVATLAVLAFLLPTLLAALPATAPAAEKIEFLLPVRGTAAYPVYIAKHVGYFEAEGLDVEVVPGKGSTYVVQQVAAGTVPVGMAVPGAILPAVARGQKMKFFYTFAVKSLFDLVVTEDSPVKAVPDLKDKTVGITDFGGGEVPLVRALLASANLTPGGNVTLLPIGEKVPTILAAFRDGKIQAFAGNANDLVWLYQAGFKPRSLSGEFRDLPASGFFATEKEFTERRDTLVKIGRAVAKGTLFGMTNPDGASALLAKLFPDQFQNMEGGRAFYRVYLDLSTPQRRQGSEPLFGYAMPEGWERLQQVFLSGDKPILAKPVDLAGLVTGELVPEINRFDHDQVRQQARAFKP